MRSIRRYWEFIQEMLDVRGDVIMCLFSAAVIFKIVYSGMGQWDTAAYAAAIGAFAYSNRGPK